MSFARARVLRGLNASLRHAGARATPRVSGPTRTQLAVGRRYASGGAHAPPSSDLPWLVGAVVVTLPSCYYLWPDSSHADAGHHGGHDEHAEAHEEKGEEGGEEEAPAEEEAPKEEDAAEDKSEEKSDDKPAEEPKAESSDEGEKKDEGEEKKEDDKPAEDSKPEESESKDESSDDKPEEGGDDDSSSADSDSKSSSPGKDRPQFKGKMKPDAAGQSDTRKSEPDSKGANKRRIDSGAQIDLNESQNDSMAKKQAGMSNTQTRHSTPIHQDPEKSKKEDGSPETAKTTGTVKTSTV